MSMASIKINNGIKMKAQNVLSAAQNGTKYIKKK